MAIHTFVLEVTILETVIYSFYKMVKASHHLCNKSRGQLKSPSIDTSGRGLLRTPLNSFENCRLEGFGEPGVHGSCLLPFTVDGLEIIQSTLACDLALELPQSIERHARSIRSVKEE